jgi:hypothetical protein
MPRRNRTDKYTIRSGSSVVVFWVGAAVMTVVIVTPLLRADWRVFTFVIAPALLLVWVLWIALYRPAVRFDARRVVVVNIGRTHVLPWPRVISIRQRLGLDFDLDGGTVVKAVGVPPPRRLGNVASMFDRRTRPTYEYSQNADLLESVRVAAAPDGAPVVSKWDTIPLAIGVALILAIAVEVLFRI